MGEFTILNRFTGLSVYQVMDDSYRFSESGLYFAPAEGNLEVSQPSSVLHLLHDQLRFASGIVQPSYVRLCQAADNFWCVDWQALREYVRSLPIEDPPETFGLHPNADITFQQKETNNMLETIILIAGGGGGGGGGGGESA